VTLSCERHCRDNIQN